MEFGDGVSFAVVPTVFKREDYKRTKHDTVFSKWQVLIGSNDWEDFKNGKDGVGRYRVQNLPRKSCPGLYELGVAVIGQEQCRKLEPDIVLASYLGQAESVRSRLQRYGRSGAHLRNVNNLNDCETIESPVKAVTGGLFEDIFSKGGSILYRWAPMGSKREAEATEGMLLSTFDYAWNKGSNGERRQLDLLKKLGDREFMSKRKSGISRMLFPFLRNQVGIRIKGEKHVLKEERKLTCDVDEEKSNNFLTSILKLTRSRPQPVSDRFDEVDGSCSDIVCGVLLEDGGCCIRSPVKGRKRCIEHKGQRVCRVSPEKQTPPKSEIFTGQDHHNHKDSDVVCGVILPDMEPCNKRPVPGRKRCEDHKGMRINAFLFLLNQTDREKTVKDEKPDPESHTESIEEEALTRFCEATTKNGLPCTRSSPKGSKRCWQQEQLRSGSIRNTTECQRARAVSPFHLPRTGNGAGTKAEASPQPNDGTRSYETRSCSTGKQRKSGFPSALRNREASPRMPNLAEERLNPSPSRRSLSTDRASTIKSRNKPDVTQNLPVSRTPFPARVPVVKSFSTVPLNPSAENNHRLHTDNSSEAFQNHQKLSARKLFPEIEEEHIRHALHIRQGGVKKTRAESSKAKAKQPSPARFQKLDVGISLRSDADSEAKVGNYQTQKGNNNHNVIHSRFQNFDVGISLFSDLCAGDKSDSTLKSDSSETDNEPPSKSKNAQRNSSKNSLNHKLRTIYAHEDTSLVDDKPSNGTAHIKEGNNNISMPEFRRSRSTHHARFMVP